MVQNLLRIFVVTFFMFLFRAVSRLSIFVARRRRLISLLMSQAPNPTIESASSKLLSVEFRSQYFSVNSAETSFIPAVEIVQKSIK